MFPIWHVGLGEYEVICSYLGITPETSLYEKLVHYLHSAPFRYRRPGGFSLYLAKPRLTRLRIARLDLVSRFLYPDHPVRYILNCIIALHECDGKGYMQMAAAPGHRKVLFAISGWLLGFLFSFIGTLTWLCATYTLYLAGLPFRPDENLEGKRVLITGVNRGLGLELLRHSLANGAEVIGTVRTTEMLGELRTRLPPEAPVRLLVTDLSRNAALSNALTEAGITPEMIDIAILSAGVKYSGESELSSRHIRDTFEVNFFSAVDFAGWYCASCSQKRLVFISSIGRWHGMRLSSGYNASKAALSIWAESLEMEAGVSGARDPTILIVEPGLFESGMVKGSGIQKLLAVSAQTVAARVLSAALGTRTRLRYPLLFTTLTLGLCAAGPRIRRYLFARLKQ